MIDDNLHICTLLNNIFQIAANYLCVEAMFLYPEQSILIMVNANDAVIYIHVLKYVKRV